MSSRRNSTKALAEADQDGGLIFAEPNGDYHMPDLVSQTVVRRLGKAGIKQASFHTLRHTHASLLLSGGVPLLRFRQGLAMRMQTLRPGSTAMHCQTMIGGGADMWDSVVKKQLQ